MPGEIAAEIARRAKEQGVMGAGPVAFASGPGWRAAFDRLARGH